MKKALYTVTHNEPAADVIHDFLSASPLPGNSFTEHHHQVSQHRYCVASVQDGGESGTERYYILFSRCLY